MVFLHAYVREVLNSMICYTPVRMHVIIVGMGRGMGRGICYTPVCMSRGDKSEYIFFYTVQCTAHSWNSVALGFHNSMNIVNEICLSGGGGRTS